MRGTYTPVNWEDCPLLTRPANVDRLGRVLPGRVMSAAKTGEVGRAARAVSMSGRIRSERMNLGAISFSPTKAPGKRTDHDNGSTFGSLAVWPTDQRQIHGFASPAFTGFAFIEYSFVKLMLRLRLLRRLEQASKPKRGQHANNIIGGLPAILLFRFVISALQNRKR
jgi:hypothetical protein